MAFLTISSMLLLKKLSAECNSRVSQSLCLIAFIKWTISRPDGKFCTMLGNDELGLIGIDVIRDHDYH